LNPIGLFTSVILIFLSAMPRSLHSLEFPVFSSQFKTTTSNL